MILLPRLRSYALIAGVLLMACVASAQSKIAVVDLQRAVLESEEIKKASSAMEAKYKPRQDELTKLQQDMATIQQQLQNPRLSQTEQDSLVAQGQKKDRDAQRLSEDLQADVDRERNDILQKSTVQMRDVIKKVADEKGFDVVLDSQSTVSFKPATDITTDVITAYNKAYPGK